MARLWLVIATMCWGGNLLVGRLAAGAFDPVSLNVARWAIAAVVLLPFALPDLVRRRAVLLREWRILLALAAAGAAVFHTLQYAALARTAAVNVALYLATVPLLVLGISRLVGGGRMSRRQLLGASASVAGAVIVVARGELDRLLGLSFAAGDLLEIAAVPFWALYCVLLSRRPPDLPGLSLVAVLSVLGVALTLPFWLVFEPAFRPGPLAFASMLYVGLFPSVLAYLCWNAGIAALEPRRAAPFNNLVPLFGALFAILFLGEPVASYHLTAAALVGLGIWAAESGRLPADATGGSPGPGVRAGAGPIDAGDRRC